MDRPVHSPRVPHAGEDGQHNMLVLVVCLEELFRVEFIPRLLKEVKNLLGDIFLL